MKHLKVRIPMYFIGLFVMTIGIALSVKSNLGVSPVSSIPYTIKSSPLLCVNFLSVICSFIILLSYESLALLSLPY